jgi:hypothetical protein
MVEAAFAALSAAGAFAKPREKARKNSVVHVSHAQLHATGTPT